MLVSHIYNFIYIKNEKVASSSVESFFGRFCCDPDYDYQYTDKIDQLKTEFGFIGRRVGGKGDRLPHIRAEQIKSKVGKLTFKKYFKFCVVRNPWDKMVSYYFWNKARMPFRKFVKRKGFGVSNWNIHTINDKPICNYYIRYEHLEKDIIEVCSRLKIKNYDIMNLPNHKSTQRRSSKHYSEYYDDELRDIVARRHKKEIDYFHHKFEDYR